MVIANILIYVIPNNDILEELSQKKFENSVHVCCSLKFTERDIFPMNFAPAIHYLTFAVTVVIA